MSTKTPAQTNLLEPISSLKGVGQKMQDLFARLDIHTTRDLIFHYPRKIIDLSNPVSFKQLQIGEKMATEGRLRDIKLDLRRGTRKKNTTANLYNSDGDSIPITWFNQGYLAKSLKNNQRAIIYGDVRFDFKKKKKTFWNPKIEFNEGIVLIYPETKGLTSKAISKISKGAGLASLHLPEIIPTQSFNLPNFNEAIEQIHNPASAAKWNLALKLLKLNELVNLFYYLKKQDWERQKLKAPNCPTPNETLKKFADALPFKLTDGQRSAAWGIIKSFQQNSPIHHLLLGDVGTGKTVVAALTAIPTLMAEKKVLWLAPTQVLATQLHQRLTKLFAPLNIKPELATSKVKPNLNAQFFVGTHALLHMDFPRNSLGLIIIDEQHKFGVKQRDALSKVGGDLHPHTLTMTATPIPRSLALSIWGERKLSILTDRPTIQQPIKTILAKDRKKIGQELKKQIASGRQAFIVAPRIEGVSLGEKEDTPRKSLEDLRQIYSQIIPNAKIAIYHGKQSQQEQEQIMNDFLLEKIDILIATSIIEVGIDVPNATVMIIEDAHWFGLAQLHQIRGRVGRGNYAGVCFVVNENAEEEVAERLKYFVKLTDGFELAEIDLKLRGPGDLLGTEQSGLPPLKIASFFDEDLIQIAKVIAKDLLDNPPKNLDDFLEIYK